MTGTTSRHTLPAVALAALLAAPLAAGPAAAQPQVQGQVPEEIGTWRLSCLTDRITDRAECLLRHREPVEQSRAPGGTSLVLEIQDRNGRLVPVVVARDLTLEAIGRGLLAVTGTAQLRFPPNRYFDMPCGLEGRSLVCAPKPEDAARASEELANAPLALVRVTGLGAASQQAQPVELELERTSDAMARFRRQIPEGSTPPRESSGLTLPDLMNRLQGLFGR